MQKQHKLIAPGAAVLDLGCAPGAWLQVSFHYSSSSPRAPEYAISPHFHMCVINFSVGCCLQVACQNLGPLEKGGVVVGVDVKVSWHLAVELSLVGAMIVAELVVCLIQ
jgi:23S rRNA U2552 (ribose-2'-O)-methylase RlmE/FtsJ